MMVISILTELVSSVKRIFTPKVLVGLWTLLTAIYEDELIEEPQGQETIIENIEKQREQLLVNILGPR